MFKDLKRGGMMKSILILPHIKIQNANAISGIVYGFPAVTHFLGFVHALSRELNAKLGLQLEGCGIICHDYQLKTQKVSYGNSVFSQQKHPLTEEGKSPSFNEEGQIHLDISLVIACNFTRDDFDFNATSNSENEKAFTALIDQLVLTKRLAGGTIVQMDPSEFHEVGEDEKEIQTFCRKIQKRLLPGFVLLDRSDLFQKYLSDNQVSPLQAMLEFYALKWKAEQIVSEEPSESKKAKWELIPKPHTGWIIPIQAGYKAISDLYGAGEVANARDPTIPFRFVEPVYGLGEWRSVHRIKHIESMIWKYRTEKDFYVCSITEENEELI